MEKVRCIKDTMMKDNREGKHKYFEIQQTISKHSKTHLNFAYVVINVL